MFIKTDSERMHVSHLLTLVGQNGCGPDNWQQLAENIKSQAEIANQNREVRNLSYAGAYDINVYPNGTFVLVPTTLTRYTLLLEEGKT